MTLLDDYLRWHRLQVETGDIDPAYPVLRTVGLAVGPEAAAWLCFHHTSHYHIGSALRSFSYGPGEALPISLLKLPTGTERRGNRDPRKFAAHWEDLRKKVAAYGGADAFLTPTRSGRAGWREIVERVEGVHGNGRWAGYKIAEVAQKVLGKPISAPDAGHANSTGPRKGLARLEKVPPGNTPRVIAYLDARTRWLQEKAKEPDVAQIETSLCDFNSLCSGHYYLGHDIDQQLEHLLAVPSDLTPLALEARRKAFPRRYLAEIRGRNGVDKMRRTAYRDKGKILEY